jgi:branched-chain amino acid transport system permease protein
MDFYVISLLNGLSYGLLLFMLSAGLTLIFSMMGVLNFAHASFYMLGAYAAFALSQYIGFWPALLIAPLVIGVLGAFFERYALRKVYAGGHVPELLLTFGLSYLVLEVVQIIWGRSAVAFAMPEQLQGALFTLMTDSEHHVGLIWRWSDPQLLQSVCTPSAVGSDVLVQCTPFPLIKAFIMLTAVLMMVLLWLVLTYTRLGLIIKAALSYPHMVEALGHDVPSVMMLVFGIGTALAGVAGVIGGVTFITEPSMAETVGSIIFVVVVVGGIGSLAGAFWASILIGVIQTFAVAVDATLINMLSLLHVQPSGALMHNVVLNLTVSQIAPVLPYLFLVLILIFRPSGLMGSKS